MVLISSLDLHGYWTLAFKVSTSLRARVRKLDRVNVENELFNIVFGVGVRGTVVVSIASVTHFGARSTHVMLSIF